jgi:hypothetical protein
MNAQDFAGIPAIRTIRNVETLGYSQLKELMRQAAPAFVSAGLNHIDALALVEKAL